MKIPDCRCIACGCCKHDHNGWRHEWTRQMVADMERITASGEDLSQEPDEWGYDDQGNVVDLRGD